MGSVTLVTGGVRSGKSAYALALANQYPAPLRRFLIATGQALDDEMRERIARHRATRPADFETVEEPLELGAALSAIGNRADIAVLDCLTLWISNLLGQGLSDSAILSQADLLASALQSASFPVVVVSDEVGWGIVPENQLARRFRDLLGWTNQKVAAIADSVVLMVAGCQMRLK
jgi:adenosylcobinamide kinase/adenosylcobinamide-phosphate guanylyltransferase